MQLTSAMKPLQTEGWRQFESVASKLTENERVELEDALRRTDRLIELMEGSTSLDGELLERLWKQTKLQQEVWFRVGAPHVEDKCGNCVACTAAAAAAAAANHT